MELVVVLFVLLLFAAMVAPNLVRMRDSQQTRAAYGQITDLISEARLTAVNDNLTYALTWDSGQNAFDLKKEPPNQDTASSSSIASPTPRPLQTASNISEFEQVKAVTIPSSLRVDTFRVGSNNTDSGSWTLHFYPDGTCDAGGFQVSAGSSIKSYLVDRYGLSTVTDGMLPDPTDVTWQAGTYYQKI